LLAGPFLVLSPLNGVEHARRLQPSIIFIGIRSVHTFKKLANQTCWCRRQNRIRNAAENFTFLAPLVPPSTIGFTHPCLIKLLTAASQLFIELFNLLFLRADGFLHAGKHGPQVVLGVFNLQFHGAVVIAGVGSVNLDLAVQHPKGQHEPISFRKLVSFKAAHQEVYRVANVVVEVALLQRKVVDKAASNRHGYRSDVFSHGDSSSQKYLCP